MNARLLARAIAFGVMMVFATTPALAGPAKLVKAEGKVWVTPPKGKEILASAGIQLAPGTRIRTGDKSSAELQFENGSTLKVRPNTSMSLSGHKRRKKKNSIVLFFGRLWSKVTKTVSRSYEIKTANAVCGVRGTEFETAVADDGSVRVRVSEGTVAVTDDSHEQGVEAGQEIAGDETGIAATSISSGSANWKAWEKKKRERLRTNGRSIVDRVKEKIMSRKAKLETLRARQQEIERSRKSAESRARRGERGALDEIRAYNKELAEIADTIADIGDEADSQFGIIDHYADLAEDPRFRSIDRKYLVSQAESLRRIKKNLDAMVKDGTDISIEAMDKLLEDMSSGRGGGLRERGGSSAKDLFGGDDMDMR